VLVRNIVHGLLLLTRSNSPDKGLTVIVGKLLTNRLLKSILQRLAEVKLDWCGI
jgi:hypothetical protein